MKIDTIKWAGVIISLLVIIMVAFIIWQNPFPVFQFAGTDTHFIPINETVGPEASDFMWNRRSIDLIAQAMVLFSTAAGCVAILRTIRDKPEVESE